MNHSTPPAPVQFTAPQLVEIDDALRSIHKWASARGLDAVIHVKADGRVYFDFEDAAAYVKLRARADLLTGGALPYPSVALSRLDASPEGR